jgi:hypothetical protein
MRNCGLLAKARMCTTKPQVLNLVMDVCAYSLITCYCLQRLFGYFFTCFGTESHLTLASAEDAHDVFALGEQDDTLRIMVRHPTLYWIV